jgi:hypothetical protein
LVTIFSLLTVSWAVIAAALVRNPRITAAPQGMPFTIDSRTA